MSRLVKERWLELTGSDGRPLLIRIVDVAHARHLRLSLGRNGPRMTKPRWVPLHEAAAFAEHKREWLEAVITEQAQRRLPMDWPAGLPAGTAVNLPLRGQRMPVHVTDAARPALTLADDGIHLALPERAPEVRQRIAAGQLRSFLEAQMRADIARLMPPHVEQLGRAPTLLRIRPLRSLWGSLSARDHLSLDLALILAPPKALEYVLVHELAHLFERNHGPNFWALVGRLLPDFRERQQLLRTEGEAVKTALELMLAR
jgi:predicted metal-dependent hydrolase